MHGMAALHFLKMSFMVHREFEKGSQNEHFKELLEGRKGVTNKSTLCTLLIMLDSGRPLCKRPTYLDMFVWRIDDPFIDFVRKHDHIMFLAQFGYHF